MRRLAWRRSTSLRLLKGLAAGFLVSLSILHVRTLYRGVKTNRDAGGLRVTYNTRAGLYAAVLTSQLTWDRASSVNRTWAAHVDKVEFFSRTLPQHSSHQNLRLITGFPLVGDSSTISTLRALQDVCYRQAGHFRWYILVADHVYLNLATMRRHLQELDHNQKILIGPDGTGRFTSAGDVIVCSHRLLQDVCAGSAVCLQDTYYRSSEQNIAGCLRTRHSAISPESQTDWFYKLPDSPRLTADGVPAPLYSQDNIMSIHPVPSAELMMAVHGWASRRAAQPVVKALEDGNEAVRVATKMAGQDQDEEPTMPYRHDKWRLVVGNSSIQSDTSCLPLEPLSEQDADRVKSVMNTAMLYADSYVRLSSEISWSLIGLYHTQNDDVIKTVVTLRSQSWSTPTPYIVRIHGVATRSVLTTKTELETSGDFWVVVYVTEPQELCGAFTKAWQIYTSLYNKTKLLVFTPYTNIQINQQKQVMSTCIGQWLMTLGAKSNDVTFAETMELNVQHKTMRSLAIKYLRTSYKRNDDVTLLLLSELHASSASLLARCRLLAPFHQETLFNAWIRNILKKMGSNARTASCHLHRF